jgi:preprotein translocase subunit SecE
MLITLLVLIAYSAAVSVIVIALDMAIEHIVTGVSKKKNSI